MKRQFVENPRIDFTWVVCPFCGQKTGPESECYLNKADRGAFLNNGMVLPVFTESCGFRAVTIFNVDINYVVTEQLREEISKISGIVKWITLSPHSFQISISKMFDVKEVKKRVAERYRNYIKELQSLEASLVDITDTTGTKTSIVMPNGINLDFSGGTTDIILQNEIFKEIEQKIFGSKVKSDPV